jgi:hypothetical protein
MKKQIYSVLLASIFIHFFVNQFNPLYAGTWRYLSKIDLTSSGTDILDITIAGENLVVLHNNQGANDDIRIFDLNSNLLRSFSTGSKFTSGIAWTGNTLIFGRGSTSDRSRFYTMNLNTGSISGPLGPEISYHPSGMTISGSKLLVSQFPGVIGRYDLNNNLSLIDTIDPPSLTDTWGITWDQNRNELFAYSPSTSSKIIYGLNANLSVIETIDVSAQVSSMVSDITMLNGDLLVANRDQKMIFRYIYIPEPSTLASLSVCTLCLLTYAWKSRKRIL